MQVTVYRSSKKDGLYVYVAPGTELASLPAPVLKQLGEPEIALELDLSTRERLSNADIGEVRESLQNSGFYVQSTSDVEALLALASRQGMRPKK